MLKEKIEMAMSCVVAKMSVTYFCQKMYYSIGNTYKYSLTENLQIFFFLQIMQYKIASMLKLICIQFSASMFYTQKLIETRNQKAWSQPIWMNVGFMHCG